MPVLSQPLLVQPRSERGFVTRERLLEFLDLDVERVAADVRGIEEVLRLAGERVRDVQDAHRSVERLENREQSAAPRHERTREALNPIHLTREPFTIRLDARGSRPAHIREDHDEGACREPADAVADRLERRGGVRSVDEDASIDRPERPAEEWSEGDVRQVLLLRHRNDPWQNLGEDGPEEARGADRRRMVRNAHHEFIRMNRSVESHGEFGADRENAFEAHAMDHSRPESRHGGERILDPPPEPGVDEEPVGESHNEREEPYARRDDDAHRHRGEYPQDRWNTHDEYLRGKMYHGSRVNKSTLSH